MQILEVINKMNKNEMVIKTEDLVKVLSGVEVIKGCSMTVKARHYIRIVGSEWCG